MVLSCIFPAGLTMFMFSFKLIYGLVCVTLSTDLSAISCECVYMKTLLFVAVDTLIGLAVACHEVGGSGALVSQPVV